MKKYLFLSFLMLLSQTILSQSMWQESIDSVEQSGYYNIQLGQRLIAKSLNSNFSDLRIFDNKNKEVPYFVRAASPVQEINSFENYVLKQNQVKDSLNIVIVDNQKAENIDRFYVVIRRADVNKYASLRGSNDLKQWYIVRQKTGVSGYGNPDEILVLDFPQGNYRYYEITLENNQSSPLEVIKVGKMKNSSIYAQFSELDLGTFSQVDSADKKTYISFSNTIDTYRINKLEFNISSKTYYLRRAVMSDSLSHSRAVFDLSAKGSNTFFVNDFLFSKNTSVVIENHSNPPLKIDSVRAYGLNRYICAYLEEGQQYTIQVGNNGNAAPKYDIEYFQNDIPADLPVIKTKGFKRIDIQQESDVRQLSWFERPVFLWTVIILIGLFLFFICVKMVKEMGAKKP